MISVDVESHLIKPGCLTPRLVCLSWKNASSSGLLDRHQGIEFVGDQLADPDVELCGHHVFYDLGVVLAEEPRLTPAIFGAFADGRIHCTKVRQQLLDIASGKMKFHVEADEDDDGEWRNRVLKTEYTLEALARRLLGKKIAKEGTWRLKYAFLDGVPIADWPAEAVDYAMGDAVATDEVFWAQQNDVYRIFGDPELPDSARQHRAAWALHLMSCRGVRTDPVVVRELRKTLEAEQEEARRKLAKTDIFRLSGSKNMQAIRDRVAAGYARKGLGEPPTTPTGLVSTSYEVLCAAAAPHVSGQEQDPLRIFADSTKGAKVLSSFVPVVERGTSVPINPSYNPLVETGRTSCAAPAMQQLPRKGKTRECFIPRPGYVFAFVDYDTLEMRTLAQVLLDLLGHSAMAETLRRDEDLHLRLAAQVLGVEYGEAVARYKQGDPEVDDRRQLAKCVAGDTPVLTTNGWRRIDSFVNAKKIGFHRLRGCTVVVDGEARRATEGYYGGVRSTWRLTAENGLDLVATPDHKIRAWRRGAWRWIALSKLTSNDWILYPVGRDRHGDDDSVPRPPYRKPRTSFQPIDLPDRMTPSFASWLGFYAAEGSASVFGTGAYVRIGMTDQDPDALRHLGDFTKNVFGDRAKRRVARPRKAGYSTLHTWNINSWQLYEWLNSVGAGTRSETKAIPEPIARGPKWAKAHFLRSLFEGDGSVSNIRSKVKNTSMRVVRLTTKSERLSSDVQLELLNMGIPSRRRWELRKGRRQDQYWTVTIAGREPLSTFRREIGFLSKRKRRILSSLLSGRFVDAGVSRMPASTDELMAWREATSGWSAREEIRRLAVLRRTVTDAMLRKIPARGSYEFVSLIRQGYSACRVKSVESTGKKQPVYDLYEPKGEAAVFGGILTKDCANFGLPGGMSAGTFVSYAAGFDITLSTELSEEIRESWFRAFPEMREYFNLVGTMTQGGSGTVVQARSGRMRGDVRFTAAANGFFQGLAADGAKDALWRMTRECYTDSRSPLWGCWPVVFVHDEVIAEVPYDPRNPARTSRAALRMRDIMVETMQEWCPDVPIKASPVLCRRWYKGAKAVHDAAGNLVPCRPEKKGDKVSWVVDL